MNAECSISVQQGIPTLLLVWFFGLLHKKFYHLENFSAFLCALGVHPLLEHEYVYKIVGGKPNGYGTPERG